jgi:hypothetical protein
MRQGLVPRRQPHDVPKVNQRHPLDHQTRNRPIQADQLDPSPRWQIHGSGLQELSTICRKRSSHWPRFVQSSILWSRQGIDFKLPKCFTKA